MTTTGDALLRGAARHSGGRCVALCLMSTASAGAGLLLPYVIGRTLDARLVGSTAQAGPAPAIAAALPATLILPVGAIVALGLTDPWLAAAFLAGAPALALLLRAFARASSECVGAYQRAQGDIAAR